MTGRVYLVGAGPGDPELLTLKALHILGTADIVLHDELVSLEVLQLVRRGAGILNVGKRCGTKTTSQEEINALMVYYASAGLTVVRLKSGDPMIFGRAEEEIAALQAAEIEFAIVPGITAALGAAAAAQVPLTQRGVSPALLLVTYNRAAGQPPVNWRSMAASGATIVIYMPGKDYHAISAELCAAGLSSHTPCIVASRASRPDQTLFATTLEQLTAIAALPAPALLIIGSVAHFAAIGSLETCTEPYSAGNDRQPPAPFN